MKERLTTCPKILSYCMCNLLPRLRSLATLDIILTENVGKCYDTYLPLSTFTCTCNTEVLQLLYRLQM